DLGLAPVAPDGVHLGETRSGDRVLASDREALEELVVDSSSSLGGDGDTATLLVELRLDVTASDVGDERVGRDLVGRLGAHVDALVTGEGTSGLATRGRDREDGDVHARLGEAALATHDVPRTRDDVRGLTVLEGVGRDLAVDVRRE